MYLTQHYKIDYNKVKTTKDIVRILKVLDMAFEQSVKDIDDIKDLVVLVDKGNTNFTLD